MSSDAKIVCASAHFAKMARSAVKTPAFWKKYGGYVAWAFVGLIIAIAGIFQPIESIRTFLVIGFIALGVVGFLFSSEGEPQNGFVVVGFGGYLLVMYGVGYAISSASPGFVLIGLVVATALFLLGVAGIKLNQ